VATITFVSVFGSQLALRGRDGSMEVAVEGMQDERHEIFVCFGVGLIFLLISVISQSILSFCGVSGLFFATET
jgi:hypothetical protein